MPFSISSSENRIPTVWRLLSVCQAPPSLAASAKEGISSSAFSISCILLSVSTLIPGTSGFVLTLVNDFGWVGVEEIGEFEGASLLKRSLARSSSSRS